MRGFYQITDHGKPFLLLGVSTVYLVHANNFLFLRLLHTAVRTSVAWEGGYHDNNDVITLERKPLRDKSAIYFLLL